MSNSNDNAATAELIAGADQAVALPGAPLKVTYTPLDDGDPSVTLCHGVRFKANVATPVNPATHGVLLELAKKNPWFEVEGHPKAERGSGKRIPKTPEEYRFYATQWFQLARSPAEFVARWKSEQGLRDSVGFGEDDQVWLDSIADPILHELEKATRDQE